MTKETTTEAHATEVRDKVFTTTAEGVGAARRYGAATFDQAAEALRAVDIGGDGVRDKPRALSAVEDAGSAIKGATAGAVGVIGAGANNASSAIGGMVTGAAGTVGSLLQRRRDAAASSDDLDSETAHESPESPAV